MMLPNDAAYLAAKVPSKDRTLRGGVGAPVDVRWDGWGIPHIRAERRADLFYALGYVTAQECLWRLELCRRQARGELAALVGDEALASDRLLRTIGVGPHADALAERLPTEEADILVAYAHGVNRWIEEAIAERRLPVELDWLGVEPRPWSVADSIACWKGRWWNFTGRLDNIAAGEAGRRVLPPELYDLYMSTELGEETILPNDDGGRRTLRSAQGQAADGGSADGGGSPVPGGADTGEGSNNWVVAGARTTSGYPVLCSDPHTPFTQPGQWFEAHLTLADGSLDVMGVTYAGWPGVYIGRNRQVAWGFTNHVASTRDLYVETVDPARPGYYLNRVRSPRSEVRSRDDETGAAEGGGTHRRQAGEGEDWQPFQVERHEIAVRGAAPFQHEVRRSVRGPVMSAFLPDLGGPPETITLRWMGVQVGTGLTAMLGLNGARTVDDALAALAEWPCSVVNALIAGTSGSIAYHVAGFVPRRSEAARRYRDAQDPAEVWQGYIPFDQLPHLVNPERGWLATANQPPWRRDPPGLSYLRGAAWADGGRMRRIHQRLTERAPLSPAEIGAIQSDITSTRAVELVASLITRLRHMAPSREGAEVARLLRDWDGRFVVDSAAPTVWVAFWEWWLRRVAAERFPQHLITLTATQAGAVARQALLGEPKGRQWFADADINAAVRETLRDAIHWLTEQLGPSPEAWLWGKAHTVTWEHLLATQGPPEMRAAAAMLFHVGPFATSGGPTVRAAGYSTAHPFRVVGGATYRLVADLSPEGSMMATANTGQSGHPGSAHYADQAPLWLEDRYHPLPFDGFDSEAVTRLEPA